MAAQEGLVSSTTGEPQASRASCLVGCPPHKAKVQIEPRRGEEAGSGSRRLGAPLSLPAPPSLVPSQEWWPGPAPAHGQVTWQWVCYLSAESLSFSHLVFETKCLAEFPMVGIGVGFQLRERSRGWAGRKGSRLHETAAQKCQVQIEAWPSCWGWGPWAAHTVSHPQCAHLSAGSTDSPPNKTAAVKCAT